MAAKLFWLAAIVQLLVSLRFTALVRVIERTHVTARVLALASGQRQDSWVTAAVIWTVILLQDTPYAQALHLCGVGALAWLILRAYQRIGVLGSSRRD